VLLTYQLRKLLIEKEKQFEHEMEGCTWHPEFGGWMIESTPSRPYSKFASDLLRVERNMIVRRRRLLSVLEPDEIAPYVRISALYPPKLTHTQNSLLT
jgi:glutamate--cysteine ligase catalytic subunit